MTEPRSASTSSREHRVAWSRTFLFASQGVFHALLHERNMRVHLTAAYAALVFCLVTRPQLGAAVAVGFCCFLVLAAEVFNTAVEALTDLVTDGDFRALAKAAKDSAAGAVLLTALGACCVAFYAAANAFPWRFLLFSSVHLATAIFSMTVMALLLGITCVSRRMRRGWDQADTWMEGRRRRPE